MSSPLPLMVRAESGTSINAEHLYAGLSSAMNSCPHSPWRAAARSPNTTTQRLSGVKTPAQRMEARWAAQSISAALLVLVKNSSMKRSWTSSFIMS